MSFLAEVRLPDAERKSVLTKTIRARGQKTYTTSARDRALRLQKFLQEEE